MGLNMEALASWQTFIGTILGACVAFAGVWWSSRTSLKQHKLQQEHEEKLQRQQIFRERLEELYGLLGQLDNYVTAEVLDVRLLVEGLITDEDYLKRHPLTEIGNSTEQTRLEMIVGIYGKGFKNAYETANDSRNGVIALKAELERLYLHDLPTEEIDHSLIEAHEEFQHAVKMLKAEIADSVLA